MSSTSHAEILLKIEALETEHHEQLCALRKEQFEKIETLYAELEKHAPEPIFHCSSCDERMQDEPVYIIRFRKDTRDFICGACIGRFEFYLATVDRSGENLVGKSESIILSSETVSFHSGYDNSFTDPHVANAKCRRFKHLPH